MSAVAVRTHPELGSLLQHPWVLAARTEVLAPPSAASRARVRMIPSPAGLAQLRGRGKASLVAELAGSAPALPDDPRIIPWRRWMAPLRQPPPSVAGAANHAAAILFSGGTTGWPKGILLSNANFIAQGMQATAWCNLGEADSILAVLPIFHGFGLGVCVNAALMAGGKTILVPQFSAEIVARLLRDARPSVLVGVPTLFDALVRDASLVRATRRDRELFQGAAVLAEQTVAQPRSAALDRRRFGPLGRGAGASVGAPREQHHGFVPQGRVAPPLEADRRDRFSGLFEGR